MLRQGSPNKAPSYLWGNAAESARPGDFTAKRTVSQPPPSAAVSHNTRPLEEAAFPSAELGECGEQERHKTMFYGTTRIKGIFFLFFLRMDESWACLHVEEREARAEGEASRHERKQSKPGSGSGVSAVKGLRSQLRPGNIIF